MAVKNIVFIFFNGGGLTDDQWINHPYEDKRTELLDRIREFGDVYLYTPTFYVNNSNVNEFKESDKEYMFKLEDLNLANHCREVESKVNHYDKYFLISHSRGWIFSQVFCSLFSDKIVGYINLDGGETYNRARRRVEGWDGNYTNIGNISNSNLLFIFNEIKRDIDVDKNIKFLNKWSKYYVYKQYSQSSLGFPDNFPIYILNNIYHDDEVNIKMKDYVETTLLDKVEYNAQYKGINNIECVWFVGYTHFFYFEKTNNIVEIISNVTNRLDAIHRGGGNIIIHISGSQGSGKSTLGNKLKYKFGDAIDVHDLDDLNSQFSQNNNDETYQNFLNNIITTREKPIIFVGLDAEMCLGTMEDSDIIYDLSANYKFYIESSTETIKQRFFRQINKLNERKEMFFELWKNDPDKTQAKLNRFVNINKWKENNIKCDNLYRDRSYVFKTQAEIYDDVCDILNENI